MSGVYHKLCDLLITKFGIAADEIQPAVTFVDLDLDSLALVEIAMAVKEEFGVEIDDSELDSKQTVADAVDLLTEKGVTV